MGNYNKIIEITTKAINYKVTHTAIIGNRGYAYLKIGKYYLAIKYFKKILLKNTDDHFTKFNYAVCLKLTKNIDGYFKLINETIKNEQTFLNSFLDLYEFYRNLNKIGDCQKLLISYKKKINKVLFNLLEINLYPIVYESDTNIKKTINNINLKIIDELSKNKTDDNKNFKAILHNYLPPTNFYLSYANYKTLEIQKNYSKYLEKVTNNFEITKQFKINKNKKIKIAFVSSILNDHTVTNLFINWYKLLNKERFDAWLIDSGSIQDDLYKKLTENNKKFYKVSGNLDNDIKHLRNLNIDVAIFLDYHMSRYNQFLSMFKFARKTCVTWGHPLSTFNKNIDFFLSGENLENKFTQMKYSEKLIKLSNLSVYYENIDLTQIQKNNSVIKKNRDINIGILQSLFKILPSEDEIFLKILDNYKNTNLYFLSSGLSFVDEIFKNRINKKLKNKKNIDRLILLPRSKRNIYLDYIRNMSFLIDSLSWSGGNTHFEALSLNKPVITVNGLTLKQNVTTGLLKRINCENLIKENKGDLLKHVEKYINNIDLIKETSINIEQNKKLLFNDV
ncbi:MAG: hypothetical protein CMI81_03025, partial [Candidatus Pelagibacter sp.]